MWPAECVRFAVCSSRQMRSKTMQGRAIQRLSALPPLPLGGSLKRVSSVTQCDRIMSTNSLATKGYAPAGKDTGVVKSKGTARLPILQGEALPMNTRKPEWLKVRSPGGPNYLRLKQLMRGQKLHSVCEEAGCPNIGECWEAGTATFLI